MSEGGCGGVSGLVDSIGRAAAALEDNDRFNVVGAWEEDVCASLAAAHPPTGCQQRIHVPRQRGEATGDIHQ